MICLERRDGRPLAIGHRGAAALAPENTVHSFRAAVSAGVDLVEFDLLALADGTLVVAHSYDLHEVGHGGLAGTMRRRGMGVEEIEAALLVTNNTRCDPPLDEDEVRKTASSVCRYRRAGKAAFR